VLSTTATAIELAFSVPVSAIAPGQSLVFYRGSKVIGGAVIDRSPRALPVAAA
jgi:tRNA U34 2-thiouridine synthase MnmA/TrmU